MANQYQSLDLSPQILEIRRRFIGNIIETPVNSELHKKLFLSQCPTSKIHLSIGDATSCVDLLLGIFYNMKSKRFFDNNEMGFVTKDLIWRINNIYKRTREFKNGIYRNDLPMIFSKIYNNLPLTIKYFVEDKFKL